MDQTRRGDIEYPVEIYYPMEIIPFRWPEIQRVMYWYAGKFPDDEWGDLFVDSLLLLFVDNRYSSSIPADEDCDMMLRYDDQTGEVAGIEIELFEYHFLKKHPDLAAEWAALKPEGKDGFHNSPWLDDELALGYARRLRDMAYEGTVTPGWPFEDLESIADRDGSFRRRRAS